MSRHISLHRGHHSAHHLALLVAVCLSAAFTSASSAAAPGAGFEALDRNADGRISLDEASADDKLFVAFKQLDTDKNGTLSKAEFEKYAAK